MKVLMILAPLIAVSFIYLMYKKDADVKKVVLSFLLLFTVIALAIIGNIMRAITPLFLTHLVAVIFAYGATIYYVLRGKFIWLALAAPVVTMIIYLILVWVGNEHLPSVI